VRSSGRLVSAISYGDGDVLGSDPAAERVGIAADDYYIGLGQAVAFGRPGQGKAIVASTQMVYPSGTTRYRNFPSRALAAMCGVFWVIFSRSAPSKQFHAIRGVHDPLMDYRFDLIHQAMMRSPVQSTAGRRGQSTPPSSASRLSVPIR
jgi:hypothetical protein